MLDVTTQTQLFQAECSRAIAQGYDPRVVAPRAARLALHQMAPKDRIPLFPGSVRDTSTIDADGIIWPDHGDRAIEVAFWKDGETWRSYCLLRDEAEQRATEHGRHEVLRRLRRAGKKRR